MSTDMNLAPYLALDIVLLTSNLVSKRLAAGDSVSSGQFNLSPPTVIRTRCVSFFKGFTLHTNVVYVISLLCGMIRFGMKVIVFVPFIPCLFPFASLPHSLLRLRVHNSLSLLSSRLSIDKRLPVASNI